MNRKRDAKFNKRAKLGNIHLSAKNRKSLASVIVFIKADNLDKRTGK